MGTKVLIVDDEAEFASALAERLILRKYEASAAYNADDAITLVKSKTPDVAGSRSLKQLRNLIPRSKSFY
jgi:DNA-binding response OmpR family regulator